MIADYFPLVFIGVVCILFIGWMFSVPSNKNIFPEGNHDKDMPIKAVNGLITLALLSDPVIFAVMIWSAYQSGEISPDTTYMQGGWLLVKIIGAVLIPWAIVLFAGGALLEDEGNSRGRRKGTVK